MGDREGKKRIISFDLDMTLFDHSCWELTPSALTALEALRGENWIVLASGRNMAQEINRYFLDRIRPDALIHQNGTRVSVGNEILYDHTMSPERVAALLRFGQENHQSIGLTQDGLDYFTWPEQVVTYDYLRYGSSDRHFADPWALTGMPVRTLVFIGSSKLAAARGVAAFEEAFPDFKLPMFAAKLGADVVEREASKANGLRRLCDYFGIGMDRTVAFGDSMNDYEIVRAAGVGIAMGNACEELKAAADYVTDRIEKDGVYNACRHFGLI